ncbi:MAG: hypothetical protein QM754_11415 [Tepidisphaeraceae bacterium]
MQIPTFWARTTLKAVARDGYDVTRTALGWSSVSQADAQAVADERARRAANHAADDREQAYEYGQVPSREPVLDSLEIDGELVAVITQNRYGSRVLNTDRVLFADIDLPEEKSPISQTASTITAFFRGMLGLKPVPAPPKVSPEEQTLAAITAWHAQHPQTAVRIYRTFAGLRLLFTDRQYSTAETDVHHFFDELKADRLYVHLTRRQETFRARLSPKPWRCGMRTPHVVSHIDHADWDKRLADWRNEYEPLAARYATCRFLQELGSPADDAVIQQIVAVHDAETIADDKPLA